MALDSRRSEQFAEEAVELEKLLVLRRFRDAEKASVELLQKLAYLSKSQTIQQRAAHVYIQAMYEQERCDLPCMALPAIVSLGRC